MRRGAGLGAVIAIVLGSAACSGGGSTPTATPTPPAAVTAAPSTTAAASTTAAPARGTPVAGGYRAVRAFPQIALGQMTDMEVVPGQPGVALVLTKDGVVYRVALDDASTQPVVFLDIRDRLIANPGQEEGLLGLAFAPEYATSGTFYLYYTRGDPRHNRLSRFTARGDTADPNSEQAVLDLPQKRFSNHNGGEITFGPDGYLYIGVGDGGGGGDPDGNGQNMNALLGKILRIDVSRQPYGIPPDNPFAQGGGAPEVYAYGLRNPWRFAFDPATGALWAADVGQNRWEEIDRIVKGANYGWNVMEGAHCFQPATGCDETGLTLPRAEYGRDGGCSVTGGYVYRGRAMPELDGWFVYGDFCSGRVWALDTADDSSPPVQLAQTGASITSFFRDSAGELYLVTFDNDILRLERAS